MQWPLLHNMTHHVRRKTRFTGEKGPSPLGLVITRYQGDMKTLKSEGLLGKTDHVIIKFTHSVKNKPPAKAGLKIEEIRTVASIP